MQLPLNCIKCPLSENIALLFQLMSGAKAFAYYCKKYTVQSVYMTDFDEAKANIKDDLRGEIYSWLLSPTHVTFIWE